MSRWLSESALLSRYLGSGLLNTVAGFAVIFVLMAAGVSPTVANIAGYAVGFVLGFAVSKKFVFRSNGRIVSESLRYIVAFLLAFLINLLVLRLCLGSKDVSAVVSQIFAGIAYTVSMYGLARYFVFRGGAHGAGS